MTGWKSVYAIGSFPKHINELNAEESDELLAKFKRTITENHDLQVRFRWRNENDLGEPKDLLSSWLDRLTHDCSYLGQQMRVPLRNLRLRRPW